MCKYNPTNPRAWAGTNEFGAGEVGVRTRQAGAEVLLASAVRVFSRCFALAAMTPPLDWKLPCWQQQQHMRFILVMHNPI